MNPTELVCTDLEHDREKVPLMKDLHELGLKHGVRMIVVAVAMAPPHTLQTMVIDHNDDTSAEECARWFQAAGNHLLESSDAMSRFADDQKQKA